MSFIFENILSFFAIFLMSCSLALQLKFIRFKKKSYPATAEATRVIHKKLFKVIKLKLLLENANHQVTIFKFKSNIKVGSRVDIIYNPYLLNEEDSSIVFSKILKKLNLYYFESPIVYLKNQNPLFFYMILLMLGLLIAIIT